MPSKIFPLWATCGGKAAARGPQKRDFGEAMLTKPDYCVGSNRR
jgi:hypothetical protein